MDNKLFRDIVKIIVFIFLLFNFNITKNILLYVFRLILPFIVGIAIAFNLNVVLKKIEKLIKKILKNTKIRRCVCLFIVLFLIFIILLFIYLLIVPQVIDSIRTISSNFNNYINAFSDSLSKFGIGKNDIYSVVNYIKNDFFKHINIEYNNFDFIINMMSKLSNVLFNIGVGLVFAIYILFQKEKLSLQFKKIMKAYLSNERIKKINYVIKVSNKIFSNFVGGQFLEAIILGILCFIGMLILGIPYATIISIIVAITALIPMFGAFIGTGIGVLFILITNPIKIIHFLLFIIVLQQIEGNIIYPRVVGKTIGLPGIWVVVAVTIGVSLFGLIGMIVSVPVVSVVYTLIKNDVNNRIKSV